MQQRVTFQELNLQMPLDDYCFCTWVACSSCAYNSVHVDHGFYTKWTSKIDSCQDANRVPTIGPQNHILENLWVICQRCSTSSFHTVCEEN